MSLLVGLICAATIIARRYGAMESIELRDYDRVLRVLREMKPIQPVIIVGITEPDIAAMGRASISDEHLAKLLSRLCEMGAAVVGVDIYRNQPEGNGRVELNDVLARNSNIVCVELLDSIGPPPILANKPRRFGTADAPIDRDGVSRKALLYLGDPRKRLAQSFSVGVANKYLESTGVILPATAEDPAHFKTFWHGRIPRFRANDGGYVGAEDEGYQYLMDFSILLGSRQYSMGAVLPEIGAPPQHEWQSLTKESVAGKIVLVGMTAPGVKDYLRIPNAGDIYGVQYHAAAIDQLVRMAQDTPPIRVWSDRTEELWIIACGVVAALTVCRVRWTWLASAIVLCGLSGLFVASRAAMAAYWWIPFAPAGIAWIACGAAVHVMVRRDRSRRRALMDRLFGAVAEPRIVDELWARRAELLDDGILRPREITATVLVIDIVGYVKTAAALASPRVQVDWLNEFLTAMTKLVRQHGGSVLRQTGDGFIAAFGVPFGGATDEQVSADAIAAVRCALSMRDELSRLNVDWAMRRLPVSKVRIGLCTGSATVAGVGGDGHEEFALLGPAVHAAACLEKLDKNAMDEQIAPAGCRIILAATTVACASAHHRPGTADDVVSRSNPTPEAGAVLKHTMQPMGSITLPDFLAPIDAFALLGERKIAAVAAKEMS